MSLTTVIACFEHEKNDYNHTLDMIIVHSYKY